MSVFASIPAFADTHYVSPISKNPLAPFVSWSTAATNIQQALDVAAAHDEVVVTNGVYFGGLQATNWVALRSVNGPQFTIVNGGSTNACLLLGESSSATGFTLTNGYYSNGGGAGNTQTNAFLTNCILVGNSAVNGGAVHGCVLSNCRLAANSAVQGGGAHFCTLYNCTVTGNSTVSDSYESGGGGAVSSSLYDCTVSSNSASGQYSEGGGLLQCDLYNCIVAGNSAEYAGGGAAECYHIWNCTIVGNSAEYGGGVWGGYLLNSIVYFNTANEGPNWSGDNFSQYLYNCCTTPMPGNAGNITSAPLFIDAAGGNLRLKSNSPCIDAGDNSYVRTTTDFDGRPRIAGGTVDIGAYEQQPGISPEFIAWLQQHSLPTDGSGDFIDSDGDGMNNWQEWVCGTDPTSDASLLKMLSLARSSSGMDLTWLGVTNRNYSLQRSTNLAVPSSFSTVATNIPGQMPTTTFTDTDAIGLGPFFYRVRVEYP